jgi:hypothetical protein
MGAQPYPVTRSGRDLRHNRRKLLKRVAADLRPAQEPAL